jgi:ribonuclease R
MNRLATATPSERLPAATPRRSRTIFYKVDLSRDRFGLQVILAKSAGRPDVHAVHYALLRSLKQAVYSPNTEGHYALAIDDYCHFTSPIRRYPDLLLHRAIRHQLAGNAADKFPYGADEMERLGEHCSMAERRADDATRDAVAWLKCEFARDHVGDEFDGTVTAVTAFGMFIEMDGIHADGLVHLSSLGDDFYHYDPVRHRLEGKRTRKAFQLGDRLRVRISQVNLDERKIDLEFVRGKRR